MKIIRLKLCTNCNVGTAEEPKWEDIISESTMPYSEANWETAKALAYNGECTIEDDGKPEPVPANEPVTWDELDAAYMTGYEEGYTEGVNGAYGNE